MHHPGTTPDATSGGCCGGHAHEPMTAEADNPVAADQGSNTAAGCCGGHHESQPEDLGYPASGEQAETDGQCGCGGAEADLSEGNDDTAAEDEACCHSTSPEQQLAEAIESQQRIAAEYANYRRRMERDRVSIGAIAKADVITQLLPILDDLDLAKKHGDLTGPLKAVSEKLRGVFTRYSVTEFGAEGDDFNPEIHEAVQDLSEGDSKVIGTVLRHGYMMGDRLVRTAMVIIADPAPAESDS